MADSIAKTISVWAAFNGGVDIIDALKAIELVRHELTETWIKANPAKIKTLWGI